MKKNYEKKFIPTTDEWVALYSTYGSQIVRALWQSGNKQDCEDALQFAMIKIMGLDAARIKSNLYVARKTIREQLKQFGYGKDG